MLKPGGQIMFSIVLKSPVLSGVLDIYKNPEWFPYMNKVYQKMYPYQFEDRPEEMLQNLLISQGFNIQYFNLQRKSYRYSTPVFESKHKIGLFSTNLKEKIYYRICTECVSFY